MQGGVIKPGMEWNGMERNGARARVLVSLVCKVGVVIDIILCSQLLL